MTTFHHYFYTPKKKQRVFSLLLILWVCAFSVAQAAEKSRDVDYLGLAALLLQDGNFDRAAVALQSVDVEKKGLDKTRFFTLKGLVDLNLKHYKTAIDYLNKAVSLGQSKAIIHVYLAQAWYGIEEYQNALAEVLAAADAGQALPGVVLLQAELQWRLHDQKASWQTLVSGARRFPDKPNFPRQQVFRLIQLGLYQEASQFGLDYLTRFSADATDYVAIGSALRESRQYQAALNFLEPAHLRFPDDERTLLVLARTYADLGHFRTAAALVERVAMNNEKYLIDAAELYRRGQQPLRALYLNRQARDQPKKLKQRLAILLAAGYHSQAMAMEEPLYRVGLLDDENIRYALAFAAFKSGDFTRAEHQLSSIKGPVLFKKASQLRQAMKSCAGNPWRCL
ncbi:MAG: tetratricopeptide repeat protein [Gammaproteobacteria bacterium]|nr:tetratricopeptide repeat protein [Gammaproteobacteria bacterium]